jgi:hypothetical protein
VQPKVCQLVSTKPQSNLKHTYPEDITAVKLELMLAKLKLLSTDILTAAAGVDWQLAAALKLSQVGVDCATAGVNAEYPPDAREGPTGLLGSSTAKRVIQLQQKWSRHQSLVKASLLREAFLRLNVDLIALKPSANCEGTHLCSAIMFHGTLGCQCSWSLA